jgi:ABC-type glutathione transport system ATPase component
MITKDGRRLKKDILPESRREKILDVRALSKIYVKGGSFLSRNHIVALTNVDFSVYSGEILGIVGESGSGKSTLAKIICGIEEPSSGSIEWSSEVRTDNPAQIVFQNPFGSFNPKLTMLYSMKEAIAYSKQLSLSDVTEAQVSGLLEEVALEGIDIRRYPHQFSGGQIQRFAIARAIVMDPALLLLDEASSALDVSVQAKILDLVKEINRMKDLSTVFISHDIDLVAYVADRIVVMAEGAVVEHGTVERVLTEPEEEYTRILIDSIPTNPYI